jgi:hypothetical protein
MKLCHTGEGYEYFRCRVGGRDDTCYVHRLTFVAENGIESLESGYHVHHKISIPWLNVGWNLEAVDAETHAEYHIGVSE